MPTCLEITEENAHANIPPYLRPKVEAPKKIKKRSSSEVMADRVFLLLEGSDIGFTSDEATLRVEEEDADGVPKTNKVAPALSKFKDDGIVEWRGKRLTRNKSLANVNYLVENARARFAAAYSRNPSL